MKIPGVKEEKKIDRERRADIVHIIISENNYFDMNMSPEQNEINAKEVCRREQDKCKVAVCGKCHEPQSVSL